MRLCFSVLILALTSASVALPIAGLAADKPSCATLLVNLAQRVQEVLQLESEIGLDPFKLGRALFGGLGFAPNEQRSLESEQPIAPELADLLMSRLIAQSQATPSEDWYRGIVELYQALSHCPSEVLNDLAVERGLDDGLWSSVKQNLELSHWPQSKFELTHADHDGLVASAQEIRQGLGFLSLSEKLLPQEFPQEIRSKLPQLKAQFISQIVVGRFGTKAWNAAGKLVEAALSTQGRSQVLELLKQAPAQDHGWVPAYDEASGEWGMREPETDLIWFNAPLARLTWEEAQAYCRQKNQFLPTREQWMAAERHSIREVFLEMRAPFSLFHRWFWISTLADGGDAWRYNGLNGLIVGNFSLSDREGDVFARCLSAALGR